VALDSSTRIGPTADGAHRPSPTASEADVAAGLAEAVEHGWLIVEETRRA